MRERRLIRGWVRPRFQLIELLGENTRADYRKRSHELHERRIVVIEAKRLFLPICHSGWQMHDFVGRGVFLKQAVGRECVMEQQEPDHSDADPEVSPNARATRSGCR